MINASKRQSSQQPKTVHLKTTKQLSGAELDSKLDELEIKHRKLAIETTTIQPPRRNKDHLETLLDNIPCVISHVSKGKFNIFQSLYSFGLNEMSRYSSHDENREEQARHDACKYE